MWCKHACKYPEHITNSEEGIMWMSASESISRFMDKNLFDFNNMVVFACFSDDHHVRRCLHGMYGSRYIRRNLLCYFWMCGNQGMVHFMESCKLTTMEVFDKAETFVPACVIQ